MAAEKISITNFNFYFLGRGHYKVLYTSPVTSKQYDCTTSNMQLIDATKNSDYPRRTELEILKKMCKDNFKKLNYKW